MLYFDMQCIDYRALDASHVKSQVLNMLIQYIEILYAKMFVIDRIYF